MKKYEVFDVIETESNEKGTILNIDGENYLIEISGDNQRNAVLTGKEIKNIIYRNSKQN